MLRLRNLTNKYQKRLIRPILAQTQATPYPATLDASLRNTDGSIRVPQNGDTGGGSTNPLNTRTANVFSLANSIIPGLVLVRALGENVAYATGNTSNVEQPWGLSANFVGGDLDDSYSSDTLTNSIGAWRGPDSLFEILAPAFNPTGLSSAFTAATSGNPVKLYAGADARLTYVASPTGTQVVVAHLVDNPATSRIVIDLKI